MDKNTKPQEQKVPWMEISVILLPIIAIFLAFIIGTLVRPSFNYPGYMMNGSIYRMDNPNVYNHMYRIDQNGTVIRGY
jgi:hypothetical protein